MRFSLGDTHLNTFNGLHYDFQASGDFLLAEEGPTEAGPNFVVQPNQVCSAQLRCPDPASLGRSHMAGRVHQ